MVVGVGGVRGGERRRRKVMVVVVRRRQREKRNVTWICTVLQYERSRGLIEAGKAGEVIATQDETAIA